VAEYHARRFNRLNIVQLGKGEGITKRIIDLVFFSHDFKMIDLKVHELTENIYSRLEWGNNTGQSLWKLNVIF
jgi:hypothetical protein